MDAQRGIARRFVIGLPRDGIAPAWERDFAAYPPAGVIVFARDFRDLDDLRRLTRRLRELARPRRLFIAIDEEGGLVSQLAGHLTVPPNAQLLARGAAPGDLAWAARVTGERLRALGVDWDFAPVADIHSEPRNPVIGPRAYGATPAEVAARVAEALAGFRAAGVASCLKHFPGHGDTTVDSHLALPTLAASREAIEARELEPFRSNRDADAVMTAHVVYTAFDGERPATFSRAVVHDLLRERLGFAGVCITDALEMKGAAEGRGPTEVGRMALEAGADLLMYAFHDEAVRRARLELANQLVDGAIDRAAFDAARPRLAAFDHAHPEPTEDELTRPLDALTPPDWEPRLEAIVERGLIARGALPRTAAALRMRTFDGAAWAMSLAPELEALGVPLVGEGAAEAIDVIAVASRTPLPAQALADLQASCAAGPTAVIGLRNDAFLEDLPGAAFTLSAADSTPLTRTVVARRLAQALRAAADARA